MAARRADALGDIAQTHYNHPENAGTTADRHQAVVHHHHLVDAGGVDCRKGAGGEE